MDLKIVASGYINLASRVVSSGIASTHAQTNYILVRGFLLRSEAHVIF